MRNEWNWDWNWNAGPRGRRMRHRPMGGGLLGLFGLLIGFRVVVSVLGVVGIVLGAVFSGLAEAFSGVMEAFGYMLSAAFSSGRVLGGAAIGLAIGLIAWRMIQNRKEAREAEKAAASCETSSVQEEYPEVQSYRTFGA